MLDAFLESIGVAKASAIGGAVGALISLKFADGLKLGGKLFMFFCGISLASFTTPVAAHYFSVGVNFYGGIGLLIGLFGMALVAALMRAIEEAWATVRDAVKEWLKSKLGR